MKKRIGQAGQTVGFRPKWPGLRDELEARAHNGHRSISEQVEMMCIHCSAIYRVAGTDSIEKILELLGAPKGVTVGGEQVVVSVFGSTNVVQRRKGGT